MFAQAGGSDIGEEVVELVPATTTEPRDEPAVRGEVGAETFERPTTGGRIEERHHVAGAHDGVELVGHVGRSEVELGQVGGQPRGTWMVGLSRCDQLGVEIDTDHLVSQRVQPATHPPGPTSGVEHARVPTDERVDESRLTVEVTPFGRHRTEPFDVPGRVARVVLDHLQPAVRAHATTVSARPDVAGDRSPASQRTHRRLAETVAVGVITKPGAASRILIVEDESSINDVIATALRYQGHSVTQFADGHAGLTEALRSTYDLVVLDVMLPGLDGFEVCRRMREAGELAPVLFLTARADTEDRIRGFVTGGDDYLTKPFSVNELVLRVGAILRRTGSAAPSGLVTFDEVTLDPLTREVRRAGRLIELSPTEFSLLHFLMVNATHVVSKAQILVDVWHDDYDGSENIVELYIGYLRRKIDDGRSPLIHTKRGVGYVLRAAQT